MSHKTSPNNRHFWLMKFVSAKTSRLRMHILDLSPITLILLFLLSTQTVNAQEPIRPLRTNKPPSIDGELNDPVWKDAVSVTGFKTWIPDFGFDMVGNTLVYMAYDKKNLYFAFRCYDSEPDKIKTSVTSRDHIFYDDWVCIHLDSYNNQQSLYKFYINAMGIQGDGLFTAEQEDISIDLVWYSEGRINNEGYTVEACIPFKSIRFSNDEPVTMRILFERNISRTSEMGTYPALDPKQGTNYLIQTQTILYQDITHYNLFELLPAITYGQNSSLEQGKMKSDGNQTDFSLTSKFGMTSDLVFDGTYNPDFSQVEADAGQVDFNLRYALYYEEKRPFFLEGKEIFNFSGGSFMGSPLRNIVHTRTIVKPIVGAKLSGKAGEKNTFASIYAVDEVTKNAQQDKFAHVGIFRYKRTLNRDSYIGSIGTVRKLDNYYNRVGGVDGQLRFTDPSRIGFYYFLSQGRSEKSNQEDGHALGFDYQYNNRDWLFYLQFNDLSENFDTDIGYLTRNNVTRVSVNSYRMLYPKSKMFLRVWPMLITRFLHDKESDLWEHYYAAVLTTTLPRSTRIRVGYTESSEIFLGKEFSTSFFRSEIYSQIIKQLFVYLDYRYNKKIRYVVDPYQGRGNSASASIVYQPTKQFNSSLDLTYSDFIREIDRKKEFDYTIIRFRNTYQMNKYLFFRAIVEYNMFHEELLTDFLASFTYIPGTVIHLGYGSLYNKTRWNDDQYVDSARFLEIKRGLFFKASYLWRL